MNLPKKDKKGNGYLSYSQISTFKRSKEDFYNQYILQIPFEGNEYTEFGSKVGKALETNDFSLFSEQEAKTLKQCTRLDLFEFNTSLVYDSFYVTGFIDTCKSDFTEIIDYKTGGKGKDEQYRNKDYTQLHLYALSLRQKHKITPNKASVEFITRNGNAFKGEQLTVSKEPIKKIEIDISYERLKFVYFDTLKTAKEIEKFYLESI